MPLKKTYTTSKCFSCFGFSLSSHPASILLWNPSTPKGVWRFPTSLLPFKGSHNHKKQTSGKGEKISACSNRAPPASYPLSFVLWGSISPLTRETSLSWREMWLVILSVLPLTLLSWRCRGPSAPSRATKRKSQSWTRLTPWHPWFLPSHAFPKLFFKNAVLLAEEMVS